jgi:hypothetical protein
MPLQIGSAIRRGRKGPIGTLGCFITLSDGFPGFISTAHVLEDRFESDNRVYATNIAGNYHYEIGEVYQPLQMGFSAISKTHNVDAGVVLLRPRVAFSTTLNGFKTVKALKSIGETRLGERVSKIGAGSQMTSGTVKVVNAQINIGNGDLFGCILVEGIQGNFSAPGDSGAIAFNNQGSAIGMVVGTINEYTIVIPIKTVMDQFDLRLFS